MPADQTQLDEILIGIEDLKKKKQKDTWDKLATIGQVISGVVLVAVGIIVTYSINRAQRESAHEITKAQIQSATSINEAQRAAAADTVRAQIENQKAIQVAQAQTSTDIQNAQSANSRDIQKAQAATSTDIGSAQARTSKEIASANLDATNRNIASDYVRNWMSAKTAPERAALLDALDAALEPERAVPLAIHLTQLGQIRADICDGGQIFDNKASLLQDPAVSRASTALLQRLKLKGAAQLKQISASGHEPDATIAKALLSDQTEVFFRLSEIDDVVKVQVGAKPVGTYEFGRTYDWVPVTHLLEPNKINDLWFIVSNGFYQGTGVRIEVRVGAQQYDRVILRHDWTWPGGESFRIKLSLLPDALGRPYLTGDLIDAIKVEKTDPYYKDRVKPCPAEISRPLIAAR